MTAYPRATANMNPPFTMKIATRIPNGSVTVHGLRSVPSECEAFMGKQGATGPGLAKHRTHSQARDATLRSFSTFYVPATPDAACAFRALRSMRGAVTVTVVMSELGWSQKRARHWLGYFSAKGVLIPTGKGHRWAA